MFNRRGSFLPGLIEQDSKQDHSPENDLLQVTVEAKEVHSILDHRNDKRPDQGTHDAPGSSRETPAPDDHRSNNRQLEHHAEVGSARRKLRRLDAATKSGTQAAHEIHKEQDLFYWNAGETGRLFVATDRVDVASPSGVPH